MKKNTLMEMGVGAGKTITIIACAIGILIN
jgi:hypothetical protein